MQDMICLYNSDFFLSLFDPELAGLHFGDALTGVRTLGEKNWSTANSGWVQNRCFAKENCGYCPSTSPKNSSIY